MNNLERRSALSQARAKALEWAKTAEENYYGHASAQTVNQKIMFADMWSNVAQALKTGDAVHDGPDY